VLWVASRNSEQDAVIDLYRQYYTVAPSRNPAGPESGTGERILRGGAWDSPPDVLWTRHNRYGSSARWDCSYKDPHHGPHLENCQRFHRLA